MDSFYGGKPGISFIIKDQFESIELMNFCFQHQYYPQKNTDGQWIRDDEEQLIPDTNNPYDKVWYGQYCIIDTINKNNVDNGKIYRRTAYKAEISHGTQYADYIGQIIGPAGGIPNIELGDIDNLKTQFNNIDFNDGGIYYKDTSTSYTSTPPSTPTPADSLYINQVNATTTITGNPTVYRSGKSYASTETPAFKYGFYTFQNNVDGSSEDNASLPLATLGIGFEIPYVDFATPAVNMQSFTEEPSVTASLVNSNNPFYYQYTFNIPGGLPGGYFSDTQTVQVQEYMDQSVPTPVPQIYDIKDIIWEPGNAQPYSLATDAQPIDNTAFSSAFVLTGKFVYPVIGEEDGWVTSTEQFYLGDVPNISHMTVTYNNAGRQYELYATYKYLSGNEIQNLDNYLYVGTVGPQSLGAFTVLLDGTYDTTVSQFPYLTVTAGENFNPQNGNLGIVASKDIIVPTGSQLPDNYPLNATFFYIYNTTVSPATWHYLGDAIGNSRIANIDTNLSDLQIMGSGSITTILLGVTEPSEATTIDDFEDAGVWRTPWE